MGKHIQLSLFDRPTFNVSRDLKKVLNHAAKKSGLSREEIADGMNRLAARYGVILAGGNGSRLTLDTLEKWINPSDTTHNIPIKALPIFCAVVRDTSALTILARPLDCEVIGPEDRKLLKWAKIKQRQRHDNKVLRQLESTL